MDQAELHPHPKCQDGLAYLVSDSLMRPCGRKKAHNSLNTQSNAGGVKFFMSPPRQPGCHSTTEPGQNYRYLLSAGPGDKQLAMVSTDMRSADGAVSHCRCTPYPTDLLLASTRDNIGVALV